MPASRISASWSERCVVVSVAKTPSGSPARLRALPGWRRWRMPGKLAAMLAVPVVVALAAGSMLIGQSAAGRAAAGKDERTVRSEQQVSRTIAAVQAERAAAREGLANARAEVNSAVAQLTSLLPTAFTGRPADVASGQLSQLDDVRGVVEPIELNGRYSALISALLDLDAALASRISDARLAARLTAAHQLSRAREYLARQQSLVDIGFTMGRLDGATLADARDATALAANRLAEFTASAAEDDLAVYSAAGAGDAVATRDRLVAGVLGNGGFETRAGVREWRTAGQPAVDRLGDVVSRLNDSAVTAARANDAASLAALRYLVIALAAAVLVAAALIIAVSRHLRASMTALVAATRELAQTTLPETLRDVRDGGGARARPSGLPAFEDKEFIALAVAFDAVYEAAV